jgi:hypothetical protein
MSYIYIPGTWGVFLLEASTIFFGYIIKEASGTKLVYLPCVSNLRGCSQPPHTTILRMDYATSTIG